MAVYGVILHWEEHTTESGETFAASDYFFVSPDAKDYLEVTRLPVINDDEEGEAVEAELQGKLAGQSTANGGRTISMRFARRFFAQQEQHPEQTVTFDSRLWPPIRSEAEMPGLPEDVGYPNLGMQEARTA